MQLVHLLKALASRFTVDALTLRMGELGYVERFRDTRMLRVPIPEDGGVSEQVEAFRRAIRRQLEGADYDVVHVRDAHSASAALDRARQLGARVVFDAGRALSENVQAQGALGEELALAEKRAITEADLVVVPTDEARSYAASLGRTDGVAVIPPGVDIDLFDHDVTDLRGPPRVMVGGPIGAGRGVRVLLRALQLVLEETVARLTLVGPVEDAFLAPFTEAVETLGLGDHIEVMGPIQNRDMPRVLSAATCCVAPSAADLALHPLACFPTKLLEYMACRRAVVAPRTAASHQVIEENIDGLLYRPREPEDLAKKILRLLTDAPLRQRLAEAGHRRVRERFPASAMRRRYLQAYLSLLPQDTWKPIGEAAQPVDAGRRSVETASDVVGQGALEVATAVTEVPSGMQNPEETAEAVSEFDREATAPRLQPGLPPGWIVAAASSSVEDETSSGEASTPAPVMDGSADDPTGPTVRGPGFAFGEIKVPRTSTDNERTGLFRVPEEPKVQTSEATEDLPAPGNELTDDMFTAAGNLLGEEQAAAGEPPAAEVRRRRSDERIRALKERARRRVEQARLERAEEGTDPTRGSS